MAAAVEQAIYAMGLNETEYVSSANRVAAANDRLIQSTEKVSVSEEKVTRATRTSADAMDKLLVQMDGAARAKQRYQQTIERVNLLQKEGIGTEEQRARVIDLATRKYMDQVAAIERATAAERQLTAARAEAANAAFNKQLGVRDDFNSAGRAADIAAYGKALDETRAKFDPLFAAELRHKRTLEEINAATRTGALTQEQANRAYLDAEKNLRTYTAANDNATRATNLLSRGAGTLRSTLGALGITLGAAGLVQMGRQIFNVTAGLQEQADQVLGAGGNVEAYQALRGVFLESGLSMQDGDRILARLTRSLGEAAEGSQKAQEAFGRLGLGANQLAGQTADAALPLIAQKLLDIKDASVRAAIETEIFSRSGQKLESALRDLATPADELIARGKELGIVLDAKDIQEADKAADSLAISWLKLSTAIAPVITDWVDGFSKALEGVNATSDGVQSLIKWVGVLAGAVAGLKLGAAFGPIGAGVGAAAGGLLGAYLSRGEESKLQGQISVLESRRKHNPQFFSQADAKRLSELRTNLDKAQGIDFVQVTPAVDLSVRTPGTWQPQAGSDRNANAFKNYLTDLQMEAQLAGLTTVEREKQQEIIKAAQAMQKSMGVEADKQVQSYAAARAVIGDTLSDQISQTLQLARQNELAASLAAQEKEIQVLAGATRDGRDLALQILNAEVQLGRELTDIEKERLRNIQAANDNRQLGDYIEDLREEVRLAGLSTDEREIQAALLKSARDMHGAITDAQKDEVAGLIRLRQETDRWRAGVDDLKSAFEDFFQDIFEKGEVSFSKLWDSIKAQYARMLAQMATQALVYPIIQPVIGMMMGGVSNMFGGTAGQLASGLAGGSGGFGVMDGLSAINSGSSLFGGGNLLGGVGNWISSGIDSLGGMLGFGTNLSLPSVSGIVPGFGAISTSPVSTVASGSLFGSATLGTALGGFGVGSLIGGLMGGNSLVSGGLGALGGIGGSMLAGTLGLGALGGPIGMVVGGLLGGALGNFGATNQGAIGNVSNNLLSYSMDSRGSEQNRQATEQVAQTLTNMAKMLASAGINIDTGVSGFSMGSDKSYIYHTNGVKEKLGITPGDTEGMLRELTWRVMNQATATTPESQHMLSRYMSNGGVNMENIEQLLSDVQFASALENISFVQKELTQSEQLLANISSQFEEAISRAQELGLSTAKIVDARNTAIQQLIDRANKENQTAIDQMTNPVLASWNALMEAQAAREKELRALGADTALMQRRNELERQGFLDQLNREQLQSLNSLSDGMVRMAINAADAEYALHQAGLALGGTVSDVSREAGEAVRMAERLVSGWSAANDNVMQAIRGLSYNDPSLSPEARLRGARSEFDRLYSAAMSGDIESANSLASFEQEFRQASLNYYGSTKAYASDVDYVRNVLGNVATFSSGQQSYAQQQVNLATQSVDRLDAIRDAISQGNATEAQTLSQLQSEVGRMANEIKLLSAQLRQRAA